MKTLAKNQNVRCEQMAPEDALEKVVQRLQEPLEEVLRPARDGGHVPRRHLREDDERDRHDPGHHHGVRDREAERPRDFHRALG